jgi:NADP-dependent 3-hydroxy acid dehydrogenase YdfG
MVVTGATGGICTAVVRAAAGRGYRVVAVGRDGDRLDALAVEVPGTVGVVLDLGRPFELPERAAAIDRVDAVGHCAGVAAVTALEESSYDGWHETLGVNVVGAAELTRLLLPALRELADSLREEERGNGLRVTTIFPGGTATQLLRTVREQFGHPFRAEDCIQPASLASIVLMALDLPPDSYLSELSVLPAPGRRTP